MRSETVIGWDLGGAHLKAARLDASGAVGPVVQLPCPLWQGLQHLDAALQQAVSTLGRAPIHAVTMTGEMVDLFASRREGVTRLVAAMRALLPGATVRFYAGPGGWVDPDQAAGAAPLIASANWMASAELVAARVPAALFLDIGSTTTDVVVVQDGRVSARGRTDAERLSAGELVYTGVVRTPVMALADAVPFAGDWVPLMAEYFATTADVYRLTGQLPEAADLHPAADGGEKTVPASARRLARMIGRDLDSAPLAAWRGLAAWLARAQARRIEDACDRLLSRDLAADLPFVVAGVGRFVGADIPARRGKPCCDFGRLLPGSQVEPDRISDCAPAVAVAWLAKAGLSGLRERAASGGVRRGPGGGAPPPG